MYSVIISGIGGYVTSLHLNDNSSEIEANYQTQSDSVNTGYSEQIAVLNSIIEVNQKRMQSASKWTRYHAQKDLAEAQGQKTELLKLQNSQISDLKTEKTQELDTNDYINKYKAFIVVLIVMLLEFLYARSFAYEYVVERNIKTENQNHNIIQIDEPVQVESPSREPSLQEYFEMFQVLQGLQSGQMLPIQSQMKPMNQGKQMGFQFHKNGSEDSENAENKTSQRETSNEKRNTENVGDGNRICKNCNKVYTYRHRNQKYCSDECRIEAWEKRTGRKLKKGKKGGKKLVNKL